MLGTEAERRDQQMFLMPVETEDEDVERQTAQGFCATGKSHLPAPEGSGSRPPLASLVYK